MYVPGLMAERGVERERFVIQRAFTRWQYASEHGKFHTARW
jgi:hypothetical protein